MKIMIGLHHPKHYWMFRNFIFEGKKRGWEFKILISKKEVLEDLLKHDNIDYTVIGSNKSTFFEKLIEQMKWIIKTLNISRTFKPDFLLGRALISFSFVAMFRGTSFIIFEDSEPAAIVHKFTVPFSSAVITPVNFKRDFKDKHVRIQAYDELYYLHPKWFQPNESILEKYNIKKDEKYVVLRSVSWKAYHAIGRGGISTEAKSKITQLCEQLNYRVFITSESSQPQQFDKYLTKVSPHEIHHLLAYASLYVGDSQTMATEAAVLGTPSVRINSFVGENDMSNFIELEKQYSLMHNFNNKELEKAMQCIKTLLTNTELKREWLLKREKLMDEKIDPTSFLLDFIENWPDSFFNYNK